MTAAGGQAGTEEHTDTGAWLQFSRNRSCRPGSEVRINQVRNARISFTAINTGADSLKDKCLKIAMLSVKRIS